VVDAVEDWLWASISALMVCGEICVKPLPPVPVLTALEAWVLLSDVSNGLEAACVNPVDVVDDDFDDVSDLRASIAADAAPKAGNMTELRQRRITRTKVLRISSARSVPSRKTQ
jgi:hypothetical protein